MRKMLEVVKEYDQDLYEEVRFEYIHNNIELDEDEEGFFLSALHELNDIEEALEALDEHTRLIREDDSVYEVFMDEYKGYEALEHLREDEYRVYEDFEEIGNDWIDNVIGYERLENAISEVSNPFFASFMMWNFNSEDFGKHVYEHSDNMRKTRDGLIIEFYW